MRALIVSYYFPPAGGGGVQRVLKLCKHLPAFGWDVDVLAPDDPKWVAHDPGLAAEIPAGTVVHRARYRGPSDERPAADVLAGAEGLRGVATRAGLYGRQLLVPDPRVVWVPDAARAAVRIVRERSASVVLTTSPPSSAHMIGNVVAPPDRRAVDRRPARLVARQPAPALRPAQRSAPSGPCSRRWRGARSRASRRSRP